MQKNSRVAQGRHNAGSRISGGQPVHSKPPDEASSKRSGQGQHDTRLKPFEVLAIDDDPVDRSLLARAFADVGGNTSVRFCDNGSAALELLTKREGNGRLYKPDACICDINMPGMSGIDLLVRLKADETLRRIPVVMLSSSDDVRDVRQCYDLQAVSYICKPANYAELCEFVAGFARYWVELVSMPDRLNVNAGSVSE